MSEQIPIKRPKLEIFDEILEIPINTSNLEEYFGKVAKYIKNLTKAKVCLVYLKDEKKVHEGHLLRVIKTPLGDSHEEADQERILIDNSAWYYIPNRESFEDENEGKHKTYLFFNEKLFGEKISYEVFRNYPKEQKNSLMNRVDKKIKEENIYYMKYIEENYKDNLIEYYKLIEKGILPMGLTAYVAKKNETLLLHGNDVRSFKEWRGSYEGAHSLCATLCIIPLVIKDEREPIGIIKIENKQDQPNIYDVNEFENIPTEGKFKKEDQNLLEILRSTIKGAIVNLSYRKDTYRILFGTKLLKQITEMTIDSSISTKLSTIQKIIENFYNPLNNYIRDYVGIKNIFKHVKVLLMNLAAELGLNAVSDFIESIGPEFEILLGVSVRYREHFVHQLQVFLIGYYIINNSGPFREFLIDYLKNLYPQKKYSFDDVLRVWFLTAIFHDYGYAFGEMEQWLHSFEKKFTISSDNQRFIKTDRKEMYFKLKSDKFLIYQKIARVFRIEEHKIIKKIEKYFTSRNKSSNFGSRIDHGLVGGLLFMNQYRKRIDKNLLIEACTAIVLHKLSLQNELLHIDYEFLKMEDSPFSFLLVFCDNANEFGRFRMKDLRRDFSCNLKQLKVENNNEIKIELDYPEDIPDLIGNIHSHLNTATYKWQIQRDTFKFSIICYFKRLESLSYSHRHY